MGLFRTQQERPSQNSTVKTVEEVQLRPTAGVDSIALSYSKLPKNEITAVHHQHFMAARNVLWDAVNTYNENIYGVLSQPRVSKYKHDQVTNDFYKVVESARNLDFPTLALERISFEFIDVSLDYDKDLAPHERQAVADMGLVIGHDKVRDSKVRHIAGHHLNTLQLSRKKAFSEAQISKVMMTEGMLSELGVTIDAEQIPSVAAALAEYGRERARKTAITGAAALISTTIFAPSIAHASTEPVVSASASSSSASQTLQKNQSNEIPASISISLGATVQNNESKLVIGMPSEQTEAPVSLNISAPSEAPVSATLNTKVGVAAGTEVAPEQSVVPISATPQAPEMNTSTPIAIDTQAKAPEQSAISVSTPVPETETKKEAVVNTDNIGVPEAPYAEDGTPVPTDPVAIVAEKESDTPKLNEKTATPEQLAIQSIIETINNDGNTSMAAGLILKNFHNKDQIVTSYKNGEPVYAVTNPSLVKNITDLSGTYKGLISARGHADVNYVNTTLIAYATFEAAANDQSILGSPDIQQLIAGVKRPDDEYLGKLYDQYVGKAKEALSAERGVLVEGINAQYLPQVEAMYAYVLLANVSDAEQAAQIQAIKDAEAAAAAAAARQGNYTTTPEAEAIKNLIDREQDPAKKRTFMAMNYLMANAGLSPHQAAGIIGNMLVESAGTMDPTIKQFGGGPGRGMVQWEAGRFIALQNFAAAQGKTWDDFDVQMAFLVSELPGRQKTLETIKGAANIYDATREFMIRFETPRVVVDALHTKNWTKANAQAQERTNRGQPILDAFNGEVGAVAAARAAAAEAERLAKLARGMSLEEGKAFVAAYKNSPDSINYIGGAGRDCKGGPLSNCVSFSVFFINKYTNIAGMGAGTTPGNGSTVVRNIKNRNPDIEIGHTPRPNAIFSTPSGSQMCGSTKCGHTGVVLGVDAERGKIIVGEAGCNAAPDSWDTAHEYDLSKWTSEAYTYVYTDGRLTTPVQ